MLALLGNYKGVVRPWYLRLWKNKVLARRTTDGKVIIVENTKVKNIVGLPVIVKNGRVTGLYYPLSAPKVAPYVYKWDISI